MRKLQILLSAVLSAVMFLKKPAAVRHPGFWGEAGALFPPMYLSLLQLPLQLLRFNSVHLYPVLQLKKSVF